MPEPFAVGIAKKHVLRILGSTGTFALGKHAKQQMAKRNLTTVDVVNVLRCGGISVDHHDGTHWRYNAETARINVTFCFRGHEHDPDNAMPTELAVITAWRKS